MVTENECAKWISASEKVPDELGLYYVTVKERFSKTSDWNYHCDIASSYDDYIDGFWGTFNDWHEGQEVHVTHWMPVSMPEPCRGGNAEGGD